MNRRQADTAVGVLLGVVILAGALFTWQAYRQRRALDESMGSMMDTSMGTMHGPNPLWYALATVLVVAVVGGLYLVVRQTSLVFDASGDAAGGEISPGPTDSAESTEGAGQQAGAINAEAQPRARVLDLLPADERRVLEPVLDSPGITQIELRDRSDFSKSKVSQTASALEQRGLLYRERQGRTYRVYPSDDLQEREP